jgi:hypothetical protein
MSATMLAYLDAITKEQAEGKAILLDRPRVAELIEYARERAAREACEAALPDPDHWMLELVHSGHMAGDENPHTGRILVAPTERYYAVAQSAWLTEPSDWAGPDEELRGNGATPTAAYLALAAALAKR